MKIVIDNPCHENWDAMTPNEKGAFCLSCQKNVIDFSTRTIEEIKSFFTDLPKNESVCGRFNSEQLDKINFESFFKQFKKWNYFRKVAVITFFVFGFSLFGHAQNHHNREMALKGEVAVVQTDTGKVKNKKDTVKVLPPKEDNHIMGGPRYIPDEEPKNPPKDKSKPKLMGKPAVIHHKE